MNRPLRVLLVEDSEDDALLLAWEIRRGYALSLTRVETAETMQTALASQAWDLVIADYNLPQFSALAALTLVQQAGLDLPFLIVSGVVGEETAVNAMRAGARDFILKDRLSRLIPAIQRELNEAEERRRRREAEARYRELFTEMQNGFALHEVVPDDDGHPNDYRFLAVNPAFERMTGLAAADIVGRTVRAVLPGLNALWGERYGQIALTGQPMQFETYEQELRKHFQVAAFSPQRGQIAALVADVTPLREAEAARLAAQERFRHLIEHSVDIVAVVSHTGDILYVSPAVEHTFAITPDRAVRGNVFRRVHPDDQAQASRAFHRALEQPGDSVQVVCRYRHDDGSWRVIETTICSLLDNSAVAGIVLNARDVTESHKGRERLQREVARTQALLRTSGRLNAQIDLESVLKTVCEEAAHALDVPAAAIDLYDEERDVFVLTASTGLPPAYARQHRPVPKTVHEWLGPASEQPVTVIPDVQAISEMPNAALYAEFAIRTIMAARLTRGQQVLGDLQVITTGETRRFSEDEVGLLRGLADQAVNAIANATLYSQATLRLERLRALHTIDSAIIAQAQLESSLRTVVEQVARQLRVDAVAVLLYNPDRAVLEYAAGIGFRSDAIRQVVVPLGAGHAGRAAHTGRIDYHEIEDTTQPSLRAELWQAERFVSHYSIPLTAQSQLLGVLDILHRAPLEPNAEWLAYLEALALQTAIAIDRAALLTRTQEQARQLAQILRTVPEGIALLDAASRIVTANPEGERCLTILASARAGDTITALGDIPAAALLSGEALPRQVQEIVVPGDERAFEVVAEPVHDDGGIQGWVLLMRDVTEARRRRQQIAQQERLAAVGQLAAGIAHDFNNILTPIRLCVDLSRDAAADNPRLRTNLDQIRTAADRAGDLVSQILAFSRRETRTKPTPIVAQDIVQEALQLVRAGLPPRIELQTSLNDAAGMVLMVPSQMHQIVMNLCTNAFHAMREHGDVLSVMLESYTLRRALATVGGEVAPGSYVRLTVRDNGHGMDAATRDRIFEPFFTTKPPGEGTGMGLSVVFGIVAENGGGVQVESAPGQGATFAVYLPRVEAEATAHAPTLHAPERGHERILVVDDEPQITTTLCALLAQMGYDVAMAANGPEALALLDHSAARFDLVVTDLSLPAMSGVDLAKEIRSRSDGTRIVLMSGHHDAQTIVSDPDAGFRAFLAKPFDAGMVSHVIRGALS
jgi:PAS domain S-box-containing protein